MSDAPRYITGLRGIQAFVVRDLDIPISDDPTQPRHLILTGPNGSGKSSILLGLRNELQAYPSGPARTMAALEAELVRIERSRRDHSWRQARRRAAQATQAELKQGPIVEVQGLDPDAFLIAEQVLVYLDAKRNFKPQPVSGPNSNKPKAGPQVQNLAEHFLQYLVNKRTEQAYAREDNDSATADAIATWFEGVTAAIRELFGDPKLELSLDRKTFEYRLVLGGERPTAIEQLPDGLRSVLQIWAEILLHYEALAAELGREPGGFVLIDEVELHLHAELQERLMPFLTKLFPTLQFIVTTHSPAVASSIAGATVFDLESREAVASEELRGQRYGELLVDWFGIGTDFDLETSRELEELERLARAKPSPETPERARLEELAGRLSTRSHLLAIQVWRELQREHD